MMVYEMLAFAFVALRAPVLATYAGYELRRKPFELVALSGLFFMLAVTFGFLPVGESMLTAIWNFLAVICYFVGWVSMLIGAVWQLVTVIRVREARQHG
ncbi:MAG: hypothetical protein HY914_05785 [Desulfomonile tiedjei]|nr:hypothetical protein [Desulfomonile tiedjei]